MSKTVAVFGATGAQGAPVVEQALQSGLEVRAIARDADRVRVRHPRAHSMAADLADRRSMEVALDGVDAAFVHLPIPGAPDDASRWLGVVLEAAERVNLPLLVFSTSGPSGSRYPSSVVIDGSTAASRAVLAAGTPAIVLQPTLYLENLLPEVFVPRLRTEGVLDYPPLRASQRITWTSHHDQAAVAVAAFSRPDLAGRAFEIGTPHALDGTELATLLTPRGARQVSFDPLEPHAFGQRVGNALSSPGTAFALTDLYEALDGIEDDGMIIDTAALETVFDVTLESVSDHIERWSIR